MFLFLFKLKYFMLHQLINVIQFMLLMFIILSHILQNSTPEFMFHSQLSTKGMKFTLGALWFLELGHSCFL